MKKSWCFVFFFIFLIVGMSFAIAQASDEASTQESEQSKIIKASQCLDEKINTRTCSSLSSEEAIFSLLALKKCKEKVESDSRNNGECWPNSGCKIKTTAQTVLALNSVD